MPHTYTAADMAYCKAHLASDGYDNVAAHIGVATEALRMMVKRWRERGEAIETDNDVPVGTVTIRKDRKVTREWIKTETGWKRGVIVDRPPKGDKPEKKPLKTQRQPKIKVSKTKPRIEPVRLPDKPIGAGTWTALNSKTLVLRKAV